MSVYTTCEITKEDALELIMKILSFATNKQLADMLFDLYAEDTLYNFKIINNYEDSDWDHKYCDIEHEFED